MLYVAPLGGAAHSTTQKKTITTRKTEKCVDEHQQKQPIN